MLHLFPNLLPYQWFCLGTLSLAERLIPPDTCPNPEPKSRYRQSKRKTSFALGLFSRYQIIVLYHRLISTRPTVAIPTKLKATVYQSDKCRQDRRSQALWASFVKFLHVTCLASLTLFLTFENITKNIRPDQRLL